MATNCVRVYSLENACIIYEALVGNQRTVAIVITADAVAVAKVNCE